MVRREELVGIDKIFKETSKVDKRRAIHYESSNPAEIWKEVIAKDTEQIRGLCKTMIDVCTEHVSPWIFNTMAELFYAVIYQSWGKFINESDYMADETGIVSRAQMAFLQRQYTLAHALCSTVTTWDDENREMICMRSLDWSASDEIAKCTRIFELLDNKHKKVAEVAGIAGMIGVLTGVKKGFSLAVNYAPWHSSARFHSDPTFLMRELLQNGSIDNFEEAVGAVKSWKVGAPCFITICGEAKGQAIVVEFGKGDEKNLRKAMEDGLLVQTNHYDLSSGLADHNEPFYDGELTEDEWYCSDLLKNSNKRRQLIEDALQQAGQNNETLEKRLIDIFKTPPVMNHKTGQWVFMRPKQGKMDLWACKSVYDCQEGQT
jgi:hypothetical protein